MVIITLIFITIAALIYEDCWSLNYFFCMQMCDKVGPDVTNKTHKHVTRETAPQML